MTARLKIIIAMIIWGSLGIFARNIDMASSQIALLRGAIGTSFLILVLLVTKTNIDYKEIKSNLKFLLLSGFCISFNWILLFESYKYTDVSIATICYYFSPIFVIVLSIILFKEKLNITNIICVVSAMIGLIIIVGSDVIGFSFSSDNLRGIFFGIAAGFLYAIVVISNKCIKHINGLELTVIQLGIATVVLLPYILATSNFHFNINSASFINIIILGVVHTGFAYYIYFSSIKKVSVHTTAVLSYLDPICAIIFSVTILNETLTIVHIIGGALVIGATFVHSLSNN